MEHKQQNCLGGINLLFTPGGSAEEIEACKELCSRTERYGGFAVFARSCHFKPLHRKNYLVSESVVDVYLKERVQE